VDGLDQQQLSARLFAEYLYGLLPYRLQLESEVLKKAITAE
jgi:hypothetical protein